MSDAAKRKPDWTLCVKEGERWRDIGAAWDTDRGNVFLVLKEAMRPGTAMLFPYREPRSRPPARPARHWRPEPRPAAPAAPPAPPTPPVEDDSCPDPEAPSWL